MLPAPASALSMVTWSDVSRACGGRGGEVNDGDEDGRGGAELARAAGAVGVSTGKACTALWRLRRENRGRRGIVVVAHMEHREGGGVARWRLTRRRMGTSDGGEEIR